MKPICISVANNNILRKTLFLYTNELKLRYYNILIWLLIWYFIYLINKTGQWKTCDLHVFLSDDYSSLWELTCVVNWVTKFWFCEKITIILWKTAGINKSDFTERTRFYLHGLTELTFTLEIQTNSKRSVCSNTNWQYLIRKLLISLKYLLLSDLFAIKY